MLKKISEYFTYILLKLEHGTHLADALDFFIYDTIKIFYLLSVIIFVISIIRSYFLPEKTKRILSHKKEFIGNILAALLCIVNFYRIDDEKASLLGLRGSPAVLMNGEYIQPVDVTGFS